MNEQEWKEHFNQMKESGTISSKQHAEMTQNTKAWTLVYEDLKNWQPGHGY